MRDTFVTAIQIFAIGFSFGVAGPCFLSCSPALITYSLGTKRKLNEVLSDIFIFLSGRLLAYILLGYLAGLSGVVLRQFMSSHLASFLKPVSGVISIIWGVFVLISKQSDSFVCRWIQNKISNFTSLLLLGFFIGISPCVPLLALLSEIVLISKSSWDGVCYGLFFGLGTFISGLIIIGAMTGILRGLAERIFRSKNSRFIFRIVCALLLILWGLSLIFNRYPHSVISLP